jgi:hypothetical protein
MEKNNFKTINIHNQTTFPIEARIQESGIQKFPSRIEPWNNITIKKKLQQEPKISLLYN